MSDTNELIGKMIRLAGSTYEVATDRDVERAKATSEALLTWNADLALRKTHPQFETYLKSILEAKGL